MSIQISVIIWTVICFLLLMLILHNWLFKPVLEVMEKRRNRIEEARKKQAEAERLSVQHEQKLAEQKAAFEKEQEILCDAEIERIQNDSKKAVEAARISRLNTYQVYREECLEEYTRIISSAEASTKQVAEIFADRIINQG